MVGRWYRWGWSLLILSAWAGGARLQAQADPADSLFLDGVRWQLVDRPDAALSAYKAVLVHQADHAAACYAIASIKADQQQWTDALAYGEKAALLDPDNLWYKVLLSQVYRLTGQLSKAVEVLGQLRRMDSTNLDFAYRQSDLYLAQGDMASALRVYDELERMFEPCDEWSMQKYKLLLSQGRTAEARAEIEKISAHVPGDPKYYEILAQMSSKDGDYAEAFKYYKKILAIKPDDAYTYASMADYYRKTGNEKKAVESLKRAVSLPGLDDETRLTLVRMFFSEKQGFQLEKMGSHLYLGLVDTLLRMYPANAQLHFIKGLYEAVAGADGAALLHLEESLRLDPQAYNTYRVLLNVLKFERDWRKMDAYADEALRFFPGSVLFGCYKTLAAYSLGQFSSCLLYGEAALKSRAYVEEDADLWGQFLYACVGDCYFQAGRYAEYMRLMDEALLVYPEDMFVRNNYAYQLGLMNTRLDEAERMAELACRKMPSHYSFWDTYAFVLFRKGDYAAADMAVRQAMKRGGKRAAVVWEHAGDIWYQQRKTDKAVAAWRKGLELLESGLSISRDSLTAKELDEALWMIEGLKQKMEQRRWIERPL